MTEMAMFVVFFLLLCCNNVFASYPLSIVNPDSCSDEEYFDSTHLECRKCGQDAQQQSYQRKAPDGLSCVCKPRYKLIDRDGQDIKCEPCSSTQVTSLDGWNCVSCQDENFSNNVSETCPPCKNGILEERNFDGKIEQFCRKCGDNTWPDKNGARCIRCSMAASSGKSCSCPSDTYTLTGGTCVPNADLLPTKPSLFTVISKKGEKIRSQFFVEQFQASVYNCKVRKNSTACQVLANICALLYYNINSHLSGESDACIEYMKLTAPNSGRPVQQPQYTPWLYYLEDDAKTELYKTNVPNEFTSNPELKTSKLYFIAFKYALNGTFLGMQHLRSENLQLCKNLNNEHSEVAFTFGTNYNQECHLNIQQLWDDSELVFYDLFLSSNGTSNRGTMYPVPVLIQNLKKSGHEVNKGIDISKWQLVRRFFLTDPVSAVESSAEIHQPLAKMFRYAKDISIRIIMWKEDNKEGTIYPPLLTVNYDEVAKEDYPKNIRVPVSFSVSYSMDQDKTKQDISIALGVLSALSVLWAAFKTWGWSRRAGKEAVDLVTLGKFLIHICGTLATMFFLVVFCASLNWLIIFKRQDVIHLLLPTSEQEEFLHIYLSIAFVMKTFQLIHLLAIQCTVDIFFIDWERRRLRSTSLPGRTSSASGTKASGDTPSASSSGEKATGSGSTKATPDKQPSEMAGVSIWRTYFVANEWAELQTLRRIYLSLQLFGVLFFLKVVGFENLAFADPVREVASSNIHENVPYSVTCRFAIGAAVYISVALIQIAAYKVFYERFVEDKLQQFVDLCSVSNVSVFIMSAMKYGYYIHGRSAHGRADVNMKEMHELLRREEEDLCGHRGLLPNTEQQTFQMALPAGVYSQYERLLLPLTSYSQAADRMQGVGGHLSRVDIDRVVHIYQMINKFLSGFIEHAFKDLDYVVKDRVLLENILDVECYEVTDRGFLYNDNGHSFDEVLLCGHEATLVLFDVLLFSVIDLASQDFVLSAVLTFIVGKGIESLRQSAGRRNLVRKALVDERFLT